jgi:hypothetical protein
MFLYEQSIPRAAGDRLALENRSNADDIVPICGECIVGSEQTEPVAPRLRDEGPVEWIPMNRRQSRTTAAASSTVNDSA